MFELGTILFYHEMNVPINISNYIHVTYNVIIYKAYKFHRNLSRIYHIHNM